MNDLEANKEAVRTYLSAMGAGDVELVRSVIADDLSATVCGQGDSFGTMNGDAVLDFVNRVPQIAPGGFDFEILSLTAEDDRVVSEVVGRATFPSGVEYVNEYTHHFLFRDGKISRIREYLDTTVAQTILLPAVKRAYAEAP
jgi:ketosteroid isomerase-like protein